MGWKFEVSKWALDHGRYTYLPVYQGQSLIKALLAMRKAKRTAGCVKLEWR